MFKSDIFKSAIRPIFTKDGSLNPNCFVEVTSENSKVTIESINIQTLPYRESIIALALVEVSKYNESYKIRLKKKLLEAIQVKQKPGKGKKKQELTEMDLKISVEVPNQIEIKQKKIEIYNQFKQILESRIREFELNLAYEQKN